MASAWDSDQPAAAGGSAWDSSPAPAQQGPTLKGLEQGAAQNLQRAGRWLAQGTASKASGLSQALDYQRRRSQEAIFHKGSSDANREALRKAIPGFASGYNDDTLFGNGDGKGIPIPKGVQHAIRGVEDFSLDTLTDPLTYETFALGPIVKGLSKGLEGVAHGLARFAPETAKDVKAGVNVARERLSLGGREAELLRRSHGKGAKDTVLGAKTHSDAEGAHVATLLQKRMAAAVQHLKPPERVEVLKVLNGEKPMPPTGPVRDAALSMRKTTDDQLYLQLNDRSRQLFPLARRGVRTDVTPRVNRPPAASPGMPVVRYQRPGSTGLGSELRGGRHFTVGHESTTYQGGEFGGSEGGTERIAGHANPTNPLRIEGAGPGFHSVSTPGMEAIKKLGDDKLVNLAKSANNEGSIGAQRTLLERVGIGREEADKIISRVGSKGVIDRAGAELARRAGHDAIHVMPKDGEQELVMLDHKFDPAAPSSDFEAFEAGLPKRVGKGLRAKVGNLPARPYELPKNLQEFASTPGDATLRNFRRKYVAGLAPEAEGGPTARGAFTANPLEYQNPNLLGRQDLTIDAADPEKYLGALNRSAENASRALSSTRLRARLAEEFGGSIPESAIKAIEQKFRATGDERNDVERVLDGIRRVTGYGKAATTQLSPMHAANVMALSVLHNPLGTPKVLGTAAKLLKHRNDPEKTFEILRPGMERGAIGPAKDHQQFFEKVPVLGKWSKLMGDITWGVDNAAKTEYAKSLGNGYSAGRRASEDLIDYRYPSDFSRNVLSLISRFPTYRSQLLQAVIKGVARNPARAAGTMRATGGLSTGDEVNIGGHKVKSYASTGDVGRAVGDPWGFGRSTLGDPQKIALTLAGLSHGRSPKYFTYGKDVDIKYILNALAAGLPEGRTIMDETGQGLFPASGIGPDLLFSTTGTNVR